MKEQRHCLGVGKSVTKTKGSLCSQCSIIQYTALIDERSMWNKGGNIGTSNDRDGINKVHTKDDNTPKSGALRQFPCCW